MNMVYAYRLIDSTEYGVLKDFLYEAIFVPEGAEPPPHDVIYSPALHRYVEDFGKQGDVCYVCASDGRIIGAAWSRILDEPSNRGYGNAGAGIPELAISVLPEVRGHGIGTELLKRLHTALAELGYKRISLSVQKANPALRLYERCGYKVFKEQETDCIMVKRLDGKEAVAFGLTLEELWQLFPIELAEHNPAWRDWYKDEESSLTALLGGAVSKIEHIGSTAIDGLLAKPIVDILLQAAPDCDVNWLKTSLANGGWLLMAEQTSPDVRSDWNKGYTPDGFAERVFHLHVRLTGDWDEPRFRDYIASHLEAAAEYEALKRRLLIEYKHNRDAYTDAKSRFIRDCVAKARDGKGVCENID
jgi:GrpB-like predicted nucleotidyltransferase (UPF0157 family)/ribosomal protein S18 acetylase RimI-like enzyme